MASESSSSWSSTSESPPLVGLADLRSHRFEVAFGEIAEDLRELFLEHALDELALLADFAHAVEELHLHGIALGAFGEMEQGIVDVFEQRADQAVDALEGYAANELEQLAQPVPGTGQATLALLQFDDSVGFVFGGGHGASIRSSNRSSLLKAHSLPQDRQSFMCRASRECDARHNSPFLFRGCLARKVGQLQGADRLIRQHHRNIVLDPVERLAVTRDQRLGQRQADRGSGDGQQRAGADAAIDGLELVAPGRAHRRLRQRATEDVEQVFVHGVDSDAGGLPR